MSKELDALAMAEARLLAPYNLSPKSLNKVFGEILSHKVDYADLYFQYQRSEGWSLEEGIVKSGSFNIEQGVGVRAISGEKTAFAYSDDINLAALMQTAKATRAIADEGASKRVKIGEVVRPRSLYSADDPIASLQDVDKVRLLERLEGFARALDPRIIQVMAYLAATWEVIMVARSDGHIAADVRPLVRVSVSVVMEDKGHREQGSSGGGGRVDYS
ncbi:MAG TPA: DNA gyrase modulator, partial [Rhodocyclaceae bacterium]|nr:DNA gyrase modulator [Rhodocyclaceae bacterium]